MPKRAESRHPQTCGIQIPTNLWNPDGIQTPTNPSGTQRNPDTHKPVGRGIHRVALLSIPRGIQGIQTPTDLSVGNPDTQEFRGIQTPTNLSVERIPTPTNLSVGIPTPTNLSVGESTGIPTPTNLSVGESTASLC
jgi:hypothetical protein